MTYLTDDRIPFYRDQAPMRGRCVMAAWTPEAIRDRESGYIRRILAGEDCGAEIKADPHLHEKLKGNLLKNLENR